VCTLLIRPDSGTRSSGQSLEWLGGGFRATIFAPKTSYLFGPTAGGLALAEDFSISAIPFLANSASSGCLAR